jgi:hypothetical protein
MGQMFKNVRTSTDDNAQVKNILGNHQLIIQETAEKVGISLVYSTQFSQKTQNTLDLSKICAKTLD